MSIEYTLEQLTAAINNLARAIQSQQPQQVEVEVTEPAPEVPKSKQATVSLEGVRAALQSIDRPKAKAILKKVGKVDRLPDLAEDKYAAVVEAINKEKGK